MICTVQDLTQIQQILWVPQIFLLCTLEMVLPVYSALYKYNYYYYYY